MSPIILLDVHLEQPDRDISVDDPQGHPHIVDFKSVDDYNLTSDSINAVDVLCTVLYNWNLKALSSLLDLTKGHFYFGQYDPGYETYAGKLGNEIYIYRDGTKVLVGIIAKGFKDPDFEVTYEIDANGKWVLEEIKTTHYQTDGSESIQPQITKARDVVADPPYSSPAGQTDRAICVDIDSIVASYLFTVATRERGENEGDSAGKVI